MRQKYRPGRKGAGLELAMIAMLVVFILCSCVVTVSVLHTGQVNRVSQNITDRVQLDSMAEAYCSAEARGISWTPEDDDSYRSETVKSGELKTLRLFRTADDTLLLTIVLEKTGKNYRVIQWTYE